MAKQLFRVNSPVRSTLALGSLLLVASTWPLWTPQQLFPRVPLFSGPAHWPATLDSGLTWCLTIGWLLTMLALLWPTLSHRWQRILALAYGLLWAGLVVMDQHRLQPWGVHIAISLLIVTTMPPALGRRWLIAFTASIYIYSALSKFDAQFLHTVGQEFLNGILKFMGASAATWPVSAQLVAASLFPMGELLCGLALLWRPTRRSGLWLASTMHVLLILVLGPLGLRHSWGVLLWNALFVALNLQLWWLEGRQGGRLDQDSEAEQTVGNNWQTKLVGSIVVLAMCVPIGERMGWVDHWLGWAVYAPHSSRALVEISPSAVDELPQQVQPYMLQVDDNQLWSVVALDRWSLDTLGVPIYPQQRFYVAVARSLAGPLHEFDIQVTLLGTADRWSGRRPKRLVSGRRALMAAGDEYWFNAEPVGPRQSR